MIPWYKITSLVIRIFSKPLITYTKGLHTNNKNISFQARQLRKFFLFLGRKYDYCEAQINKRFFDSEKQEYFTKPLKDDALLDKGAQFFSEIFLYSILIGLPIYEMMRQSKEQLIKSECQKQRIQNIEYGIRSSTELSNNLNREIITLSQSSQNIMRLFKDLEDTIQYDFKQISGQVRESKGQSQLVDSYVKSSQQ